ncbi:hypothetical protein [Emticicia sp. TH156]|uniref:hypothetical protein n=1 Tax=Emticicia sp. TH156 TaxID=2067454 RepID=UPI000CC29F0F|nr:hypothetical protein [Emticicia sp. TH156]PLK46349.1 hypothetical protein C0V77_03120 [Emticicia sp. TH156]
MAKNSYISRSFGLLMFVMVVLTSVLGKQIYHKHSPEAPVAVEKTKADKADKKDNSKEQTVVREVSLEVVVPSHAFDFGHYAIRVPLPQIIYVVVETSVKTITKPLYRLSYFEKLYEHHIAPNAP